MMKQAYRKVRYMSAAMLVLITLIVIISVCSKQDQPNEREYPDHILIKNNEADFDRMEQFVSRFKNGKPDYLLIIPSIIDGGYSIYDLHSDGNNVSIRIDHTRGFLSDMNNIQVSCKGISIVDERSEEGGTRRVLEAQHCDGDQTVEKFQITSLKKE